MELNLTQQEFLMMQDLLERLKKFHLVTSLDVGGRDKDGDFICVRTKWGDNRSAQVILAAALHALSEEVEVKESANTVTLLFHKGGVYDNTN